MGIKTTGERCTQQDNGFIDLNATHLHYCNRHWTVYHGHVQTRRILTVVVQDQHHRAGTCHKWVSPIRWCGQPCENGQLLCENHRIRVEQAQVRRVQRRIERQEQRARIEQLVEEYMARQPPMTWRQVIDDVLHGQTNIQRHDAYTVAHRYFLDPVVVEPGIEHRWQFDRYWAWSRNGRQGEPPNLHIPPPPPHQPPARQTELADIAADRQNVHTRYVSEQTNKGLEKLLKISETHKERFKAIRAPDWLAAKWLPRGYGNWQHVSVTVNDMYRWYETETCRTHRDWLYKRALVGLYFLIRDTKDEAIQAEMYKRVFEECYESIGLCCDGHISRLCNVLVGFDDTFEPPVPFGEILQNKMAAIASMDVDTDEKIRQATTFFNEFAVPEAERSAWLEAF